MSTKNDRPADPIVLDERGLAALITAKSGSTVPPAESDAETDQDCQDCD